MKNDLTDITLVVDRSGSMASVREDAEGGINEFIKGQAGEPGQANLTLVHFDTEYEFVHQGEPIGTVPTYRLEPRGMTALLDAVGRAINETGKRLAAVPETERPGLVAFVVMTDGLENSSREFTKKKVREMIEHQQDRYNWKFTFLGANQDAFAEAGALGIQLEGAAQFARGSEKAAFGSTMDKLARMRAQARRCESIENAFTDEERERMNKPS